ncbi:Hypothetical protein FKW44_012126, partial [Caligus rogercresseyi]
MRLIFISDEPYICRPMTSLPTNFTMCAFKKSDYVSNFVKSGQGWELPLAN